MKTLNPQHLPIVATVSLFTAMATLGSVFYDGFFSLQVFLNLLIDNAFLVIVAVGSVIASTTMVPASLVEKHGWSPSVVIPLVLLMGTLFGVLMLGILQTLISFDGTLSSWWTRIVVGALLFLFCLLQRGFAAHKSPQP